MRPRFIVHLLDGTHWHCSGDEEQVFDEVAQQEGFQSFAVMLTELQMHPREFYVTRYTLESREPPGPQSFTSQMREAIKLSWQAAKRRSNA